MNAYFWVALGAILVIGLTLVLDDVTDGLTDGLGPDWLSLPVLAATVAAFGLGAGAVAGSGGTTLVAVAVGAASGVGAGALGARFIGAAMRMRTDPPVRHTDLQGKVGRVVTPVLPGQPGEVLVPLAGTSHKVVAHTTHPSHAIPLGAEVVVVEVTSPTSVVVSPLGLPDQQELSQ